MVWATHNIQTILHAVRVAFSLAYVNTKVERRFSACSKTVTVSRTCLTEASINNFQIATDEPKCLIVCHTMFQSLLHLKSWVNQPMKVIICDSKLKNLEKVEAEKVDMSKKWKFKNRNQIQEKRRSYIKKLRSEEQTSNFCFLKYNKSFHAIFTTQWSHLVFLL